MPTSFSFTFEDQGDNGAIIQYRRATSLSILAVQQVLGALLFSSYFFFWVIMIGSLVVLVKLSLLASSSAVLLAAAYIASLFVYKPHLTKGWPFHWFLYGKLTDWVLGYYGATCLREGPKPDPSRKYLFAMAPHGVFGVCRAFSGGVLWRKLYPGITARWGSFGGAFYIPGVREFSLV